MTTNVIIILILTAAVLLVGLIVLWKSGEEEPEDVLVEPADRETPPPDDSRPWPAWRPTLPVDPEAIADAFVSYSGGKYPFVVFVHGTCVVIEKEDTQKGIKEQAKEFLADLVTRQPDFAPMDMPDDNVLVEYKGPVFSVVFDSEMEDYRAAIETHHQRGLIEGEELVNEDGETNVFDELGMMGLLGRARLFMDADEMRVSRVWRPGTE